MSKSSDVLYVVMPAYNEGMNIESVVNEWLLVLKNKSPKSRLVVADSGSNDDTHEILLRIRSKNKQLEILSNTNQYHGPKIIALYRYAIENGADYVFQTDSDGQTNYREFESFWDKRNDYDGVLGFRNSRGDGKVRAFVEKVVCSLLRLFFDVTVPDANAPFRLMNVRMLAKYIDKIPSDYDLPNIILTAYFVRFGENVTFEKVSFKPRTAGVNSINLKKIFKIGRESLKNFWLFKREMIKMNPELAKKIALRKCGTVFNILCLVVMSFVAVAISPSSPWIDGQTATDSSVFLTVGDQMKVGQVPYLDTFDHKGPLLYLINFAGVLINKDSGILVFEFLSVFVAVVFMYRTARLLVKRRAPCVFLTFLALSVFVSLNLLDLGNLTEEYALPSIALLVYYFVKYFRKDQLSVISVVFIGLSFACVALLRINMVAVWAPLCIGIAVDLIMKKRYMVFWKSLVSFIVGVLVVIVPVCIWLIAAGGMESFIDAYLLFNLKYSRAAIYEIVTSAFFFLKNIILCIGMALSLYYAVICRNSKIFSWSFLVGLILSFVTVCMSGRNYSHYGMILVPMFVVPFGFLFQEFWGEKSNNALGIVAILLFFSLCFTGWFQAFEKVAVSIGSRKKNVEIADEICIMVDDFTDKSDRIVVYGNWNYIYRHCDRLPASRYSYQYPIGDIDPSIADEFFDEVLEKKPKIFVIQPGYYDGRVSKFLEQNDYDKVWAEDESGALVYVAHSN